MEDCHRPHARWAFYERLRDRLAASLEACIAEEDCMPAAGVACRGLVPILAELGRVGGQEFLAGRPSSGRGRLVALRGGSCAYSSNGAAAGPDHAIVRVVVPPLPGLRWLARIQVPWRLGRCALMCGFGDFGGERAARVAEEAFVEIRAGVLRMLQHRGDWLDSFAARAAAAEEAGDPAAAGAYWMLDADRDRPLEDRRIFLLQSAAVCLAAAAGALEIARGDSPPGPPDLENFRRAYRLVRRDALRSAAGDPPEPLNAERGRDLRRAWRVWHAVFGLREDAFRNFHDEPERLGTWACIERAAALSSAPAPADAASSSASAPADAASSSADASAPADKK